MQCDALSPPSSLHLFIAGLSGRALAQAVVGLGMSCTVADCFGDADTREYAEAWHDIADVPSDALHMNAAKLMKAFDDCVQSLSPQQRLVVLTATGFESQLELLAALEARAEASNAHCAFNRVAVMREVIDPEHLFAACDALHIAHPETKSTPPDNNDAVWLTKQRGGHGASHVRPYVSEHASVYKSLSKSAYYQQYIDGSEHSVLAINNELPTVYIGLNEQQIAKSDDSSWSYRGAISHTISHAIAHATATPDWAKHLMPKLRALCERLKLRGLFSADVIVKEGVAYLLEINARPTASFELLNGPRALLEHLKAFGIALDVDHSTLTHAHQPHYAGHRYVFAAHELRITQALNARLQAQGLKSQITDWPMLNTRVDQGMPLCNLHARGESAAQVKLRLDALEASLQQTINDMSNAQTLKEAA